MGNKEALKKLRQERSVSVAGAKERIKTQNKLIKKIKEQIKDEGRTVPEIAEAINASTSQVLVFVSTLKKYGEVVEDAKDGDYFKYRIAD
ncbi:MAG: winged helix-turn-helix domain-containing protein [Deltaproteobacteria bacterium]|nr:winged helix-turn-helix domain-containing protein [Deltaproteobacteria bacterium]